MFLALILFQSCYLSDNYIIGKFLISQANSSERILNGIYADKTLIDIYLNNKMIDFNQTIVFPKSGEYTIKYDFKVKIDGMNRLFYRCDSLVSLDLSHFDASNVIEMDSTFRESRNLLAVNLANFDASKVTYMGGLFKYCTGLISIDLSTFKTSDALTDIRNMFENCASLRYLNLENFYTKNIDVMYYLFAGCKSLKTLDLSSFDTENVNYMRDMFSGCISLTDLNIKKFNTKNARDMRNMFRQCSELKTLDLAHFEISTNTDMSYMFAGCTSLKLLILPKIVSTMSPANMLSGTDAKVVYQ